MTMDECIDIFTPALKALWGEAGNRVWVAKLLDDLLHRTEYHDYSGRVNEHNPITDEYKRELVTLAEAGPNAQTILAMIRVKREDCMMTEEKSPKTFLNFRPRNTDAKHIEDLKVLALDQYDVYFAYYLAPRGSTYKEIAHDFGLSLGTVRSRMHRAKRKIIKMRRQEEQRNEIVQKLTAEASAGESACRQPTGTPLLAPFGELEGVEQSPLAPEATPQGNEEA